jgi:hypothetical protein
MKTTLLLAALISCTALSHAQTTPSASPAAATAGSPAGVAGTKNVGTDRADAPQAPGMSAASATPSGQRGHARAADRRAARKATTGKPAPMPK